MAIILFVDDEENIIKALKRVFFRFDDHELLFSTDPREAEALVKEKNVDVVVSDIRMAHMSGVELMGRINEYDSDIVCIALSGNADFNDIKDALNQGVIWRYIDKPWDRNNLLLTVKNAVDLHAKRVENRLLIDELEKKKQELEEMNHTLEDLVAVRTRMLEERSRIMSMIVNDFNMEKILSAVSENIIFFGQVDRVLLFSPYISAPFIYPALTSGNRDDYRFLESDIPFDKSGLYTTDSYIAAQLLKHKQELGVLIAYGIHGSAYTDLFDIIHTFSDLLTIYLYQEKTIHDLPDMLSDIDNIIGSI
ncbi:MAG: response regulator [Fibrobacterota bacterium]